MTDETANDATEGTDTGTEHVPAPVEAQTPALMTAEDYERPTWWNRFLSPLVIPIACVLAILFFVLSISRIFLAAEGSLAVIFGTIITLVILIGASLVANSKLQSSSRAVVMLGFVAAIGLFGMVSIGDAEPEQVAEVTQCTPIEQTLVVKAGPGLKFDKKAYEIKGGCVEVDFEVVESSHDFTWDPGGPTMPKLVGSAGDGGQKFATPMTPGTYTFYCSIPGHRSAGMEATLTVT